MTKNKVMKGILYWAIALIVLAAMVCYSVFDWSTQVINVNRYLDSIIKAVATILLAMSLSKIIAFIMHKFSARTQRGQTVVKLMASIVKYVVGIVSVVLVLSYFIEDTTSLITGISMLTLVIGLGAQSLISDIVAGIFIVFEGDYIVGDVVVIDGWRGTVNEIGLRTTKIEDAGGNIQIINNSKIAKVINNSRNLSIAVCEVGIEYEESIERVESILRKNLDSFKAKISAIADGPYYKGIESLADSSVVIKIVAKCKEEDKYQVQRDLNRAIKLLFDENGIGIPFPQVTVSEHSGSATVATKREINAANKFISEQKELSKDVEESNS